MLEKWVLSSQPAGREKLGASWGGIEGSGGVCDASDDEEESEGDEGGGCLAACCCSSRLDADERVRVCGRIVRWKPGR